MGNGNARIFVYDANNDTELRSNRTYDEAIGILEVRGQINSVKLLFHLLFFIFYSNH